VALNASALRQNLAKRRDDSNSSNSTQRASVARPTSSRKQVAAQREAPHSIDAEKGVLGSMLQDPKNAIPEASRGCQAWFFYVPTHRTTFEALTDFWDSAASVDLITFTQFLRDKGILDQIGGPGFITDLFTFVPSPVNLGHYMSIVREKAMLREMISIGSGLVRASNGDVGSSEEIANILDTFGRKMERVKHEAGGPNGSEKFEISVLRSFDAKHDPDCLIGNRYMVRGGNCLWAGGSGYGKSSLMMQVVVHLATGTPIYGLKSYRPLKQLIIQAENDQGDMSEQLNGVFNGIARIGEIDLEGNAEKIEKNIGIHRVLGKSGNSFLALLDTLLEIDRPDMVWIDPLFSFAGCDLMNAEKTGRFLREGLFPIFVKRKVCGQVLHHIGKPPKEEGQEASTIDLQYLGFGTSEIQNSFRAVNILKSVGGGIFKLAFTKRGERAGARTPDGEWTREVYLQHSKLEDGICWTQCDEPEGKESPAQKFSARQILDEMSVTHPIKTKTLQKRMYDDYNMSRATFFRLFAELQKDKKAVESDGGWIRKGLVKI